MSSVSTYLNFDGTTEAAFYYYAKTFGTEITSITRMGDMPSGPGRTSWSTCRRLLPMRIAARWCWRSKALR